MRSLFLIFVALTAITRAHATIDASLQMQLGNPSGAIADTNNHNHYLIQRTVEALDYSDNLGEPVWASWDLTAADVGSAPRATTYHMRVHPDVLEIRWHIYAKAEKWETCVDIATTLVKLAPQRHIGWIHRSFALHELKRTEEAFDQLLPAAEKFPKVWTIPCNLACYCSRLERFDEAIKWFKQAMALDEKIVQASGIDDPDLMPLWNSMSGTLWKAE